MARDSLREKDVSLAVEVRQYNGKRWKTYNRPTSSEVTALLVDDFVDINSQRDILAEHCTNGLQGYLTCTPRSWQSSTHSMEKTGTKLRLNS